MSTTFAYTAIGRDGRQSTGTVAADTRAAAIAQVVRQGMHPLKVDEARNGASGAAAAAKASAAAGKPGRVPAKAIEAFTRELAGLLAGGVPLSRALHLLRREASTRPRRTSGVRSTTTSSAAPRSPTRSPSTPSRSPPSTSR
jgi:type II secretory pathway component PulF